MPKIAPELSALQVKHLGNGTFSVGGVKGLYIRKTDSRSYFFLRYADAAGRRHDLSIGVYPDCSLKEARIRASEQRKLKESGQNPVEVRKAEKEQQKREVQIKKQILNVSTFEKIAMEWIADRARNGYWQKNIKGEKETTQILYKHVFPTIGALDIEQITPELIRTCFEPIWQSIPSTAKKARTYVNKIFQWAIAFKKRQNQVNPADMNGPFGVLIEPLQKNKKPKRHYPACSVEELPLLMKVIHQNTSMSAKATEFAILTTGRSKAVRLAEWTEFDLKNGVWVIPKDHDKMKDENRDRTIFLSSYALALLKDLVRFSESPYVFTSNRGNHLGDDAFREFVTGLHEKKLAEDGVGWIDPVQTQQMKIPRKITVHGTSRATFRTWAKSDELKNNRKFDQEAVEMCMLHGKKDAYNGAYDRAPLAKERRKLMEAWGKYCYSCKERK